LLILHEESYPTLFFFKKIMCGIAQGRLHLINVREHKEEHLRGRLVKVQSTTRLLLFKFVMLVCIIIWD